MQQCIEAIQNSSIQDFEIILIDNNSTDGSADFLESKYQNSITLIKNLDNRGFGKACNQGLHIAKGEYTLFLNPDTIIGHTTLERCVNFAQETDNLGLLGLRMVNEKGMFLTESKRGIPSPKASFFRLTGLNSLLTNSKTANAYYAPHVAESVRGKVDVISGAFMLAETEKLKSLKGFDEDYFMYGEDIDLSYRSKQAGFDNYYLGTETILHHKGKSTDKTSSQYTNRFYGAMSIFHKKHVKDSYSRIFNILISLAIFLRKGLSTISLMIQNAFLPLLEFSLFLTGGIIIKYLWSRFYFGDVNYYEDSGATINLILYSVFWIVVLLLGSAYRYYKKRSIAVIQLIIGLIFILVLYSVLPIEWRSSRALIALYFLCNVIVILVSRSIYSAFVKDDFVLGHNVGLVAGSGIIDKIYDINTGLNGNSRNFFPIKPSSQFSGESYVGDFENILQLSSTHRFDSVLISVNDFELAEAISTVDILKEYGLHATIIDQHDIQNVITENVKHKDLLDSKAMDFKILFWENRFIKRAFDVIFGILLVPIAIFHNRLKLSDLAMVICNKKSVVGYQQHDIYLHKLPHLKTGVIPVSRRRGLGRDVHIENLDYALHYSVFSDFKNLLYFLL